VEETEEWGRNENARKITVEGPNKNVTEIPTRKQDENI
jgi:hypothetical protein